MSTPQTRSKNHEKQRSTRQSTSGETVPVPAFAVGADRPAFRPIKEEPIDFTDLSDLTIDTDDDMEITFGDHPVLVAPSTTRSSTASPMDVTNDGTVRKLQDEFNAASAKKSTPTNQGTATAAKAPASAPAGPAPTTKSPPPAATKHPALGSAAPVKPGRIINGEKHENPSHSAPAVNHSYDSLPDDVLVEDVEASLLSIEQVTARLALFEPINLLEDLTMSNTARHNAVDEHLELTKQLATMKQQKTTKGPQRQAHEKELKEMEKKVKRALRERHTADRIVARFKQGLKRKHQLLDAQRRLVSAFHERTLQMEEAARGRRQAQGRRRPRAVFHRCAKRTQTTQTKEMAKQTDWGLTQVQPQQITQTK
eukprot:SAG11_NODE_1068_length_5979_cov_9.282653_7_plen_368_part_00